MIPFEFLALGIMWVLFIMGFVLKDEWFVALSGMGLMILGIYIIINGVGSLNLWMTTLMGIIHIGVGAIAFIKPILEVINENM